MDDNMAEQNNLKQVFLNDISNIADTLINAFDLKFEEEVPSLSAPLMRWLDFTSRFVEPKPRNVVLSKKFPSCIPAAAEQAFKLFCNIAEQGGDLNPFQGKGLIEHNDCSAEKKQKRTDRLWASWNILHFHLTPDSKVGNSYFFPRSDWLAFAIFVNDSIGIIDIKNHQDDDLFSDVNLIKTIGESWPNYMEKFELVGVDASEQTFTSAEHAELWKAGIGTPVCIGKKTYLGLGGGITSAATSTKVTLKSDRVKSLIKSLAEIVASEEEQFKQNVKKTGISIFEFHLCRTPNGLAVFEKNSNIVSQFSDADKNLTSKIFVELTNLLLPVWTLGRINTAVPLVSG